MNAAQMHKVDKLTGQSLLYCLLQQQTHHAFTITCCTVNDKDTHIPCVAVLVTNLLLHLSVSECFKERTPLVGFWLTSNGNFHHWQWSLTAHANMTSCRENDKMTLNTRTSQHLYTALYFPEEKNTIFVLYKKLYDITEKQWSVHMIMETFIYSTQVIQGHEWS